MKLPIKNITRLILKANDKQIENSAWELYLTVYPYMNKETFIPFEDFYNPGQIKTEDKTEEEILSEVKEILDSFSGGDENRDI